MLEVWYYGGGRNQPEKYPYGCLLVRDRAGFIFLRVILAP